MGKKCLLQKIKPNRIIWFDSNRTVFWKIVRFNFFQNSLIFFLDRFISIQFGQPFYTQILFSLFKEANHRQNHHIAIGKRKNSGQSSRWRQESEGSPPCHISRSFISAGLGDEGQVVAICEDDVPSTLDLVRPCPPDFQLGNWRVEERPGIYATSIM